MHNRTRMVLVSLFVLLLIDGLSLGIVFPLVDPLIMDASSGMLPMGASSMVRTLLYGVTLAMFPLFAMFGAPILGDLSDRIGRKKALMFALGGSVVAYILSGLAVDIHSVSLFIFSRALDGLTFGSQPIAQAAIIDVSPPGKKSTYLSYVLLSVCVGFALGPVLAAYLSDPRIMSVFSPATPLYIASVVCVINLLMLQVLYKETHVVTERHRLQLSKGLALFAEAFQRKEIRFLSIAYFILQFAWGVFIQFSPLFLSSQYHFSGRMISLFYVVIAIIMGVALTSLVPKLSQKIPPAKLSLLAMVFLFVGLLLMSLTPALPVLWFGIFLSSIGGVAAYIAYISCFSDIVGEERQGWIMGIITAIWAGSWTIISLVSGAISGWTTTLPLMASVVFMLVPIVMLARYNKKPQ